MPEAVRLRTLATFITRHAITDDNNNMGFVKPHDDDVFGLALYCLLVKRLNHGRMTDLEQLKAFWRTIPAELLVAYYYV